MLDHAEGIAALAVEPQDRIADGAQQCAVHPGPDLVKEDDLGIDHHRAAQFKQLFLSAGQVAGKFISDLTKLQEVDHIISAFAQPRFLGANLAGPEPGIYQLFP
ncbi:MAG: Uncharacterised protein [SAR116 cluster bacterium]|nr:MAG: Uncharacterised protein [SAR116 cluster bacterium]